MQDSTVEMYEFQDEMHELLSKMHDVLLKHKKGTFPIRNGPYSYFERSVNVI